MSLAERIKERARALGFDLVGITTPDPPPHAAFYTDWLAAGYHGNMGYLATRRAVERRKDPRGILPECKAIIAVAVNYYASPPPATPPTRPPGVLSPSFGDTRGQSDSPFPGATASAQWERAPGGEPRGRVARYAWGADYHDVLPRKLRELVAFIEAEAGHPVGHRIYTDTGPLLERDLAQRAGLGWIGKNTNLINPKIGSWLLLGEVLLDLALDPDPPFVPDQCGSCTRCIDACPTDAILEGRILDARRCISYHTIELKEAIPEEFRSAICDWLFGCDLCQEVCPWNVRFAEASRLQGAPVDLAPRPGQNSLALDDLLRLTDGNFRARFGDTCLARSKRRGLMRNAVVAAGNSGDEKILTLLAEAAETADDPMVREHAVWAMGQSSLKSVSLQCSVVSHQRPRLKTDGR